MTATNVPAGFPAAGTGQDGIGRGEAIRGPAGPVSPLQPCGTAAAAQRHRRRGEPLCDPCRTATRTYNRDYARSARQLAAWRARQAETKRRWDQAHRAQLNEARRARNERALDDARNALDEIAIERACRGDLVRLTGPERLEAVRLLLDRRLLPTHIAERLHVNGQTAKALIAAVTEEAVA